MWAVLREFDPGDLYDVQPAGDFTPMRALVEVLRDRPYADLLSAHTSLFSFTITPALDYAEACRFDSVLVDYSPRTKTRRCSRPAIVDGDRSQADGTAGE